jgi:hypothetical protein
VVKPTAQNVCCAESIPYFETVSNKTLITIICSPNCGLLPAIRLDQNDQILPPTAALRLPLALPNIITAFPLSLILNCTP